MTSRLFSSVATETSRLIRTTDVPDIESLQEGDLVICPEEWGVEEFAEECSARGINVAYGWYRYENETVASRPALPGKSPKRTVRFDYTSALDTSRAGRPTDLIEPTAVAASEEAFAKTWDALVADSDSGMGYEPAGEYLPQDWLRFLPFPSLNPAQTQAVGRIMAPGHAIFVAPTGAGKTVMGMVAALREIKDRGGKAAWLVPQRSLTAELDRELDVWRNQGMKVVALSGESSADARRIRSADLIVATTEKFEAMCRATSMKETISQIGTLVVDEIHLLGEPSRGPVLETLLARIRKIESDVRLVGLSATASNAQEVADWLGADLVEIAWRPTRLTQQVLTIPTGDRQSEGRWRNTVATQITKDVTMDGGSTLVFCGTKANVRSTALAIAHSRGVQTAGIDNGDIEAVAEACDRAGVGLHYSDWPGKRKAERDFRDRKTNVLVATSTLAAGVNTPARVVVVRDTSIGPNPMEVSMVQQMFGRAGRAGKEPEGWSFLVANQTEAMQWRSRLSDGYTIRSGMLGSLADHLLGEVVQGNITTLREAESWWESTFAYHQGSKTASAVTSARDLLEKWRFIEVEEIAQADQSIKATRLGSVTSKMMVEVMDAANLLSVLTKTPTPGSAKAAEEVLMRAVAVSVRAFDQGPDAPVEQSGAVTRIIAAGGDLRRVSGGSPRGKQRAKGCEVAHAGLLITTRTPRAMLSSGRLVAGVTRSLFNPVLFDSPRYFAWLAAVGAYQAVPAWASVVALDLGRRVAWYRTLPSRGHGRLLALCEKVVGTSDTSSVARLFSEAREAGIHAPEGWSLPRPSGAIVSPSEYTSLTSGLSVSARGKTVRATAGATVLWGGREPGWKRVSMKSGTGSAGSDLVVAFSPSGDCRGTEWMEQFASPDR